VRSDWHVYDVQGMRAGRASARDTLYRRFHTRVLAYLSAFIVDRDTLWDLTHDVFVKAFEGAARFEGEPAAVSAWLLAIAHNTAIDHLRGARLVEAEEPWRLDRRIERAAPDDRPEWGENTAVHYAVGSLPRQQRDVLLLHYREDRDVTEIGETLGKSSDAVRHIEQRALRTIRGRLAEEEDGHRMPTTVTTSRATPAPNSVTLTTTAYA
jgi:RNA polymerase sigma-70 factor (ECF subfamily)